MLLEDVRQVVRHDLDAPSAASLGSVCRAEYAVHALRKLRWKTKHSTITAAANQGYGALVAWWLVDASPQELRTSFNLREMDGIHRLCTAAGSSPAFFERLYTVVWVNTKTSILRVIAQLLCEEHWPAAEIALRARFIYDTRVAYREDSISVDIIIEHWLETITGRVLIDPSMRNRMLKGGLKILEKHVGLPYILKAFTGSIGLPHVRQTNGKVLFEVLCEYKAFDALVWYMTDYCKRAFVDRSLLADIIQVAIGTVLAYPSADDTRYVLLLFREWLGKPLDRGPLQQKHPTANADMLAILWQPQ